MKAIRRFRHEMIVSNDRPEAIAGLGVCVQTGAAFILET
jgi:hypothetical protein